MLAPRGARANLRRRARGVRSPSTDWLRRIGSRQLGTAATTRYYVYDRDNQLVAETDPLGGITREYVYLDGKLVALLHAPATAAGCAAAEGAGAWIVVPLAWLFWFWRRQRRSGRAAAPSPRLRRAFHAALLASSAAMGLGADCNPPVPGAEAFPEVAFVSTDHRGAPMRVTDEAGDLVWSATYDAFGEIHIDPRSQIRLNVRYPGQYESSLERIGSGVTMYYNWSRYYEPSTGRYTTPESRTIELLTPLLPGDRLLLPLPDAYGYSWGSPLAFADRDGLYPSPAGDDPPPGYPPIPDLDRRAKCTRCTVRYEYCLDSCQDNPDFDPNILPMACPANDSPGEKCKERCREWLHKCQAKHCFPASE